MKCRFCSDKATSVCGFTLTEPRITLPSELNVGDLVQSSRDLGYYMIDRLTGPHTSPFVALGCWQYEFYTAQLSGKRHKGLNYGDPLCRFWSCAMNSAQPQCVKLTTWIAETQTSARIIGSSKK